MRFDIITLFPEMFSALRDYGVSGRAIAEGKVELHCWNLRDFADNPRRDVDDRPYGGGPGMVLRPEPLTAAVQAVRQARADEAPVFYLSPHGRVLDQAAVRHLADEGRGWIAVAGRYEGVDQRWIDACVDQEWSVGDYVLSGGEIPAMTMLDATIRLLPGVLGNEESAKQDSYGENGLPDCAHYTRPREFLGRKVPPELVSGNHEQIAQWRHAQALAVQQRRRIANNRTANK